MWQRALAALPVVVAAALPRLCAPAQTRLALAAHLLFNAASTLVQAAAGRGPVRRRRRWTLARGRDEMSRLVIRVNGKRHVVKASPDTPLLYVLRNELHLNGPRFGCGLAQCGACTVHLGGKAIRSCVTPAVAAGAQAGHDARGARHGREAAPACRRRSSTTRPRSAATARTA